MIELLIAAVIFCFVPLSLYLNGRPKRFPPGPFSWPILGNFLNVGLEPHKNVMAMKHRYGNIIGLQLGSKKSVFINDYGLIKEAFNMLPFCGRPFFPHYSINGNMRGIVMVSGKVGMEQRRFAFSYIQSGFRNGVPIENLILHEANELTEHLRKNSGKPISTVHIFNIPILNVIWGIVAGERYEQSDPKIWKILDHANECTASPVGQGILLFFFKWAKMFPRLLGYNHFLYNITQVLDYMQNIVNRHRETYQDGTQRDLIDYYLQKIGSTTDEKSPFYGNTGGENLRFGLNDIFVAGVETSSTTLRWLIFLMAHYPEIQQKLSNIISLHMQSVNQPSLKDRQKLPFIEAVIMEVLRFSSILPVSIFHKATEDVQFHGYLIPKDTFVIANLYCVHHDQEVWGDPENFRPERYLNEHETEIIRHPAFIPFSTGRRVCPGESLARDELFLITMRLFQFFRVDFDPSLPIPSLDKTGPAGLVVGPVEHKVIFSERFKET